MAELVIRCVVIYAKQSFAFGMHVILVRRPGYSLSSTLGRQPQVTTATSPRCSTYCRNYKPREDITSNNSVRREPR